MAYLNETLEIRDTSQIFNLFINALLDYYDCSIFTPSSQNEDVQATQKRQLSKLELKAALILATVSRNRDNEIILKKSAMTSKLNCGKNELHRILENLRKAQLIECDKVTYDGNVRYIKVKLATSLNNKLVKKSGYIKLTAEQVDGLLNIENVRSLRLAIHQTAELHRIRTQKHETKAGTTYTSTESASILDFGVLAKISGKYVKTKKHIQQTLMDLKNLFDVEYGENTATLQFKPEYEFATYIDNKKESYYEVFDKKFSKMIEKVEFCDIKTLKHSVNPVLCLKQEMLDKKEELAGGFVEIALQNGKLFAVDIVERVLERFATTNDILKHPVRYLNTAVKKRKDELYEEDIQTEKMNRAKRLKWCQQKRLAKLKGSIA